MFFSTKLALNQTASKITNEIRRHISKTCTPASRSAIYKYYNNFINLEFDRYRNNCIKLDVSRCNGYSIRGLCTNEIIKPAVPTMSVLSKEDNEKFTTIFSDVVKDLIPRKYNDIPEVTEWLVKALQYNVPKGENFYGKSTVLAYKMLEKPENLTPENIKLANILGWCIELFLHYFILTDDIIDNTEIRCNSLCWYRKPEIGLQAINDATMIYCGAFELLKMHFSSLPCYIPLLELFHDCTMKTAMGQSLDTFCKQNNKPKLDLFTMHRYLKIAKYKTGYPTYHFVVFSGMYLANIFDEELHRKCKTVLMKMGDYLQVEDDFLDCFGSIKVTEKNGTDIQNGKCSWLVVVALERATPNQRAIIEEHYGKSEDISIQMIRNLYEELGLPSVYTKYKEDSFNLICTLIKQLPKELNHDLMFKLVNYIHRRTY